MTSSITTSIQLHVPQTRFNYSLIDDNYSVGDIQKVIINYSYRQSMLSPTTNIYSMETLKRTESVLTSEVPPL